jgi:hypothetical protein
LEQESELAFRLTLIAAASLMAVAAPALAKAPAHWDGLVQVPSKRASLLYLQPGADFRGYSKVLIDPTEVAFRKNWQRDYNRDTRSLSSRVSDSDVQGVITKAVAAADDIFAQAWTKGGFTVVQEAGPDVLRIRTGVMNVHVSAPDRPTPGMKTFSEEAGSATLFVEARDSLSGALLGRAVDQQVVGDSMALWRTSASNRADFRAVAEQWAAAMVRGVGELKSRSPIQP